MKFFFVMFYLMVACVDYYEVQAANTNHTELAKQVPEDLRIIEHFSFFGSEGIDWDALSDPNNNAILNACLRVVSEENLKSLGKTDLQERLARLECGGLIKRTGDRYSLAFPAIVDWKRTQLQQYIEQVSGKLAALGEEMIAEIGPNISDRKEMLYHVLWSDIMDGPAAWGAAEAEMKKQVRSGDISINNKAWLIYPSHPFRAGTNSYDIAPGRLQITWNKNAFYPLVIHKIVSQYENELVQAIEENRSIETAEAKDALNKYGLVDKSGKVRIYNLKEDSETAKVYMNLGAKYGREVMSHLDTAKVADMLDISPGTAFLIAYHEICWQLLCDLAGKKVLDVPLIVAKPDVDANEAYKLVTLVITSKAKYPFLETEKTEEEKTTIERFNDTKKRILTGEKYFNLSTPVDALLSYMSAVISKDKDTYKKTQAAQIGGTVEFNTEWINQYKNMCIYRVEARQQKPIEGDLHPIYVMSEGEKEFSDVEIFIYRQNMWRKLFNNGNPKTDWRKAANIYK